jgi:LysR family transcriptional regulator, hypochlorite-specific transcription factor HypT
MAEAVKAMAITGRGVAWLPESSVRAELAGNSLVIVDDTHSIDMRIHLYRSMDKVRPVVERLWTYLKSHNSVSAVA